MDPPLIHMHGIKLRRDAGLENGLLQMQRNAVAVVNHRNGSLAALSGNGDEDIPGAGIARIAKHFDDDILTATDILRRLTPFGLGAS